MTAPTLVSASTPHTNASNSLAVTMPASVVVGNLLTVEIAHGGASMLTPTGWTQEFAASNNTALFWRRADGTEGATVTFQTGTVSAITQACAKQFSGAAAGGNPIDVSTTGSNTATANSPTLTPGNTSLVDTYQVFTDFKNAARTLTGNPSGMTLRQGTTLGQYHSFDKTQAAAGSPGSLTATFSGGGSTHSTMFYAVKPSASVTAVVATASFAAQTPTVSAGANVAAVVATASFSAQAPAASAGSSATAVAATTSFAAQTPTVSAGASAVAAVGTFSFTSPAPTVAGGANVDAPAASFTMQAAAPVLTAGSAVTAPPAEFTVDAPSSILLQAGGSVLAGTPAVIFDLNAPAPTLSAAASIQSAVAAATFAAQPPTIGAGVTIEPPAATTTFAAEAPTIGAGATISVPPALCTFRAHAPRVNYVPTQHRVTFTDRSRTTAIDGHTRRGTITERPRSTIIQEA